VKKFAWLALPATIALSVALADLEIAVPQMAALQIVPLHFVPLQITEHHFPTPPPPLDPQAPDKENSSATQRIDMLQLQHDADELSRTAQTIPADIANIRKGMLPKDVVAKLKQIEKLSKHLRTELNP
jgi:hypothetical protein